MTYIGKGDKCSRWNGGVTVDKPRQKLQEGKRSRKERGWGGKCWTGLYKTALTVP